MATEIRWSPRAVSNLEEICKYIARDSKHYASLFAKKILIIIKNIPQFPRSGRAVPEYSDENLREKVYQNYRIVYRLKDDSIEIVAICHGAKQLEDVL
ncbi:MAG: type II toxin-antitoxin system RelE/ParE family toxin [Candidatus Methanoperedens sp.]|nr:type II toxin-antitoxin system RelE/ParE family toxin [Candidatus Methanoperedens sp.]